MVGVRISLLHPQAEHPGLPIFPLSLALLIIPMEPYKNEIVAQTSIDKQGTIVFAKLEQLMRL